MKKFETYKLLDKNGNIVKWYYGNLKMILNEVNAIDWLKTETLEIANRGSDKVKHRPITKEKVESLYK